MYPRTNYEMTEDDLKAILDASNPTRVMFLSGGTPIGGSQQENANRAWAELGARMGFDYMTVRPVEGKNHRCGEYRSMGADKVVAKIIVKELSTSATKKHKKGCVCVVCAREEKRREWVRLRNRTRRLIAAEKKGRVAVNSRCIPANSK